MRPRACREGGGPEIEKAEQGEAREEGLIIQDRVQGLGLGFRVQGLGFDRYKARGLIATRHVVRSLQGTWFDRYKARYLVCKARGLITTRHVV